jgi:hypothetical protein
MRSLILIHRYLGIGMGLLMVLWCLSGIVMVYHPFPRLDRLDRVAGLGTIDWQKINVPPQDVPPERPVSRFQLEMLGTRPVLRLWLLDSAPLLIDLVAAKTIGAVSAHDAMAVAKAYAAAHGLATGPLRGEKIDYDQWSVGGFGADRPLYKVALGDSHRTELYVSSRFGTLAQITNARQRFWGWLGAVPHWLYPTLLRSRPFIWSQVVIWTSLTGTFLTALGLYIGVQQLRKAGRGRWFPHQGLMRWHHISGIFFGLFALTWVMSGLLSVNPWGVMEGGGIEATQRKLGGNAPTSGSLQALLTHLQASNISGLRSLDSATLDGQLFAIGTFEDGRMVRYDAKGAVQALRDQDIAEAAARIAGPEATWQLLTREDTYHYSIMDERAQLPVVRVCKADGDLFYLDPISAALINRADAGERAYRWWHSALHRLDFWPATRSATGRNLFMLPLLIGTTALCAVGAFLGLRRISPAKES